MLNTPYPDRQALDADLDLAKCYIALKNLKTVRAIRILLPAVRKIS
jgi:hypothetical protein